MESWNLMMDENRQLKQALKHYVDESDRLKKKLALAERCLEGLKYSKYQHLVRSYYEKADKIFLVQDSHVGEQLD